MANWLNQLALANLSGYLAVPLELLALVLIIRKRLWQHSFLFTAYVGLVCLTDFILAYVGFKSAYFYISKEIVLDVVVFLLVLELNVRLLQDYPGLRRSLSSILLVSSVGLFAYTFMGKWDRNDYFYSAFLDYTTRSTQAIAVLFMILTSIIFYYRLKISLFLKYLIMGFLFFLVPHMVSYFVWGIMGDSFRLYMGIALGYSFFCSTVIWLKGALVCDQVTSVDWYPAARANYPAHPRPS